MPETANPAAAPARPTDLQRQCQNTLTKHLIGLITPVFDSTREALYSMAEKAGSTQLQNRLQEGARQLRNQQSEYTAELSQAIADSFLDFRDGTSEFHIDDPEPSTDYDDTDLQLIEEHELEESLALSDFVAKAEVRFTQQVYALNQRFAVLNRGRPVRSDTNPAGPLHISRALKRAVSAIDLASEHRVILFRRFDDTLQDELGTAYQLLNELLAEAGILPNIKFDAPKRRSSDRTGADAVGDKDAVDDDGSDFFGRAVDQVRTNDEQATDDASALLSQLRGLLDRQRGAKQPLQPQSIAPPEQIQQIVAQLRQQQSQVPTQQSAPAYTASQLRDLLSSQLGSDPATGKNYELSHRHGQTVDIVGMLYEFVQQEIALHRRVQTMLGKLQMPLLQVALKEEGVFNDAKHPARQFFNTIADAGELWLEDEPDRSPTLRKIEQMIERAADHENADGEVFGEMLGDVTKHVETLSRRAQLAEKRNIEAARGRERLETARTRSGKLIDELVRRYTPPALVESLLKEAWTDYLALVVLRDGDESERWNDGVKAAKTLTVSVRTDLEDSLRLKIHERLPWLREALHEGLAQVGYFEADIKQIIGDLEECQGWALTPQEQERAAAPASLSRPAPSNKKKRQRPSPAITQPKVVRPQVVSTPTDAAGPAAEPGTEPAPTPKADTPAAATPPSAEAQANQQASASESASATATNKIDQMLAEAADQPQPSSEVHSEQEPEPVPELTEDDLDDKERAWLAKLRIVPFGTWFEMQNSDGEWVKRKLSWFSPITGRCLFVNNRGARAQDIVLEALARDMARNQARLFRPPTKPLMDRAMEWMFAKLRRGDKTVANA